MTGLRWGVSWIVVLGARSHFGSSHFLALAQLCEICAFRAHLHVVWCVDLCSCWNTLSQWSDHIGDWRSGECLALLSIHVGADPAFGGGSCLCGLVFLSGACRNLLRPLGLRVSARLYMLEGSYACSVIFGRFRTCGL